MYEGVGKIFMDTEMKKLYILDVRKLKATINLF